MFIFGKKKKLEALNAQNKKDILAKIEILIQRTKDPAVAAKLNSAKNAILAQGATSSEEVAKLDKVILDILADLGKDLAAGNSAVVVKKLDNVLEKMETRAPYCTDNSQFLTKEDRKRAKNADNAGRKLGLNTPAAKAEDLYSPEELLEFMLIEATERQEKMTAEMQALYTRLKANPNDPVATYRWNTLKIKMKENGDRITMLQSEGNRTVLVNSMQNLTAEQKQLIASRQISDEQFDVIMADYQKMVNQQMADAAHVQQATDMFLNTSTGAAQATGASAQAAQPSILSDPDFIAMGGGAAKTPSILSDPDFIAMGGAAAAPAAGAGNAATDAVFENIDRIVHELEKCELMYSDKLDDVSADLKDMDKRLAQLLEKRKNATASECLVLDGEIDRLNAERVNAKNAIKRYRQALAVNTEKLSLARSLSNQRDLNEINRRMQESTGGAFTNFEDYAMALREYTEKANADLESIGTVNAVANGVDVNMSTMTGREADASGEFEVKDEDKYRALEEELGIRKA